MAHSAGSGPWNYIPALFQGQFAQGHGTGHGYSLLLNKSREHVLPPVLALCAVTFAEPDHTIPPYGDLRGLGGYPVADDNIPMGLRHWPGIPAIVPEGPDPP